MEGDDGVVGAGRRVGELGRGGGAGWPGRRSTSGRRATCRRERRRDGRRRATTSSPRERPISSAAMNSAEPHETSASSGSPGQLPRPARRARRCGASRPLDVGDPPGPRVGPGVEHGPRHLQLAGGGRQQAGHEQPAAEGEGGGHDVGVGGVGDDAARLLPGPLPPGPLLRRQVGAVAAGEQPAGIGDQALLARRRRRAPRGSSPGRCRHASGRTRPAGRRATR